MQLANLPALRAPFEGGLFGGVITLADGVHYAVAYLHEAKLPEPVNFDDAKAWAAEVSGQLVTRAIGSLLVATLGDLLPQTSVWTCEEDADDSSYAWFCYLYDGNVFYDNRSFRRGAVAVRLIPLSS